MKIRPLPSLFITAIILNLFSSISPTSLTYAEDAEKTEKVVVSGFGLNPEKAKENAIRNAVEQVIGAYVASESIVKNSQLLKDEILGNRGTTPILDQSP